MKLWQRFIIATIDVVRPFLGFVGNSCIYPVSCSDYAKHMIVNKPGPKSIFLIAARVISCNPISAVIMRLKKH